MAQGQLVVVHDEDALLLAAIASQEHPSGRRATLDLVDHR